MPSLTGSAGVLNRAAKRLKTLDDEIEIDISNAVTGSVLTAISKNEAEWIIPSNTGETLFMNTGEEIHFTDLSRTLCVKGINNESKFHVRDNNNNTLLNVNTNSNNVSIKNLSTISSQPETVDIGVGTKINDSANAYSISIGFGSGSNLQQSSCIAIGPVAGRSNQGSLSVAIGAQSGETTQGGSSVAIGTLAGSTNQGNGCVAVGFGSGLTNQGIRSVAIGYLAGENIGTNGIAIGKESQATGFGSIAIGSDAGKDGTGLTSICIGNAAGIYESFDRSIIINASGNVLNSTTEGLYIAPIREQTFPYSLSYNNSTKEIGYHAPTPLYGEVDSIGNETFINTFAVLSKQLETYVPAAGIITQTDNILTAFEKTTGNIDLKANLDSPTFTGTARATTHTVGNNTTLLATTGFVTAAAALKSDINSPAFLGTISAPAGRIADTIYINNTSTTPINAVPADYNGDSDVIIIRALNALTKGGRIILGSGTYYIRNPINIPDFPFTIIGTLGVIFEAGYDGKMFSSSAADSITFMDIVFTFPGNNQSIINSTNTNLIFDRCKMISYQTNNSSLININNSFLFSMNDCIINTTASVSISPIVSAIGVSINMNNVHMQGNPTIEQTLINLRNSLQTIISNCSFRNGIVAMYAANKTTYINSSIFVDASIRSQDPLTNPFVELNDCNLSSPTLIGSIGLIYLLGTTTTPTYGISTNNCTWSLGTSSYTIGHFANTGIATITLNSRNNKGDYITMFTTGTCTINNIIVEQPLKYITRNVLPITLIPTNSIAMTTDYGYCRWDGFNWEQQINQINSLTLPITHSPANNAAGTPGTIQWDNGFIYVCISPNVWKRITLLSY